MDDVYHDTRDLNINSITIFRDAEAELGTLTDADWAATIGALRNRAGVTGGLSQKPTVVARYLQEKCFPNISDTAILEVRPERGIGLCLEDFRFDDIVRWKGCELMQMVTSTVPRVYSSEKARGTVNRYISKSITSFSRIRAMSILVRI